MYDPKFKANWNYVLESDLEKFLTNSLRDGYTIISVQKTRRMFIRMYFVASYRRVEGREDDQEKGKSRS
jgi:hypothetical protein